MAPFCSRVRDDIDGVNRAQPILKLENMLLITTVLAWDGLGRGPM